MKQILDTLSYDLKKNEEIVEKYLPFLYKD